jgi:hypothetical protein
LRHYAQIYVGQRATFPFISPLRKEKLSLSFDFDMVLTPRAKVVG